jgi:PTS system fructose-specific IIA component/PTS system nitrogen regulatory IIA component
MNQEAFLDAIRDNPDDDTPRLVCADWLDEHGEPERAAFIRTQVMLARADPADPRRAELASREQALLRKNRAAWLGEPWNEVLAGVGFRRGFVHEVTIHPRVLHEAADDFFARFPLTRRVWLHETGVGARPLLDFYREPKGYYAELLRSPHLARLEALSLRDNAVGDEAVMALAGSPSAAGLRFLDLGINRIGDAGALALVASPHLASLLELDVGENPIREAAREALRSHFGQRVHFGGRWEHRPVGYGQSRPADWIVRAVILDEDRAQSKEQVIEELLAELVDAGRLERQALGSVRAALLRREQLGSTGIGRGVAIPHTSHASLGSAVGILGRTRRGVEFDSLDGEPVDVLVLALCPGGICDYTLPGARLLTELLRRPEFGRRLREAATAEEMMDVLHRAEQEAR